MTAKISFKILVSIYFAQSKKTLTAKIFFKILVSIYFAQCKKTSDEIINHVCLGITQAKVINDHNPNLFSFYKEGRPNRC